MTYPATPCRFVRSVGWQARAGASWGGCGGRATPGPHVSRLVYASGDGPRSTELAVPEGWRDVEPDSCEACGAPYDAAAGDQRRWGSCGPTYDTASGRPEPGDLYWNDHLPERPIYLPTLAYGPVRAGALCWFGWLNCLGQHLAAVLPCGHEWIVDSRASNCGLPDDRTHRCWVRKGDPESDPPTVHVSKDGETCAAGAGSIACGVGGGCYHGFLQVVDGRSTFTAG